MIDCPTCGGTGQVDGIHMVTYSDGDVAEWPTEYREGYPLPTIGDSDPDERTNIVTDVSGEMLADA